MEQLLSNLLLNKPVNQTKGSSATEHPGLGKSLFILSYKDTDAMQMGTSYLKGTKFQDMVRALKLDCWGLERKRAMVPKPDCPQDEFPGA